MYTEARPWGAFEVLFDNVRMKRIIVNPGQRLSLQSHAKRKEYWIWESGKGVVQLGDKFYLFSHEQRVIEIPAQMKHRVEVSSDADLPLTFVEFQVGEPDEEDIVRYEDDYGRA